MAVLAESDPRLPIVVESRAAANELALFMGDGRDPRFPRVTIQRCHMDDAIVGLYNHPFIDAAPLQFLV